MPVFFVYTPKKMLTYAGLPALLVMLLVLFYGFFIEPYMVQVRGVIIKDSVLYHAWGDVKIAHLSDLHVDRSGKREERVLKLLKEIDPDIIFITGDLVQWGAKTGDSVDFLEKLTAPLGVYGVLGDSDLSSGRDHCFFCHQKENLKKLRQHPVILKNNFTEILLLSPDRKMTILGVSPVDFQFKTLHERLDELPAKNDPLIVLDHFSAAWQNVKNDRPLLWLSGDNHGGQVVMPDVFWQRFSGKADPEHRAGLFTDGKHKWLYVNRGIGTTRQFPFRLGVPPEIAVITFKKGS